MQLAAALVGAGTRQRQQAARTPYASRKPVSLDNDGSVVPAGTGTQRQDERERSSHDGQVSPVEYPGVERASPYNHEIGHQSMTRQAIHEIARATGQNERQAKEG